MKPLLCTVAALMLASALALSAQPGEVIWKLPGSASSSPSLALNGNVYVGGTDRKLYALSGGAVKWSLDTGGTVKSSPAVAADGTIYVGSYSKNLIAVTPEGKQKWAFPASGDIYASPTVGGDGTIYFGTSAGSFFALSPEGSSAGN